MIRKYTQQEFDEFEIIDRIKQCPNGDYSDIKEIGERCSFGEGCSFGVGCSFGERCSFGEGCSFGERCSFGEGCSFGVGCSFGEWCSFGVGCSFGEGCKYMSFVFISVICFYGLFQFPIIIYKNKDAFVISVGCHNFDSLEKAVETAKGKNCYCEKTHKILELVLEKEKTT